MAKLSVNYIKAQYRTGVSNYVNLTTHLGLWKSEDFVISKYINNSDTILDLGCGAGRTTFGINQMGYQHIIGVDFVSEMIDAANHLNNHFDTDLDFEVGDARSLRFDDQHFDSVMFSFTGLMSIPGQVNRDAALREIHRILKNGGTFIFTTYDRNKEAAYFDFWKEERLRWANGTQRKELIEFGDIMAPSKNEDGEIYIHIPNQEEIHAWLTTFHFKVVETFYRPDKFDESEEVRASSGDCRFWVAQKAL